MSNNELKPISDLVLTVIIDLLGNSIYVSTNRTRPAYVHLDMHTGRVFYFPQHGVNA